MYGMLKEQGQLLKLITNRESDMQGFGKGIKKWFKKKQNIPPCPACMAVYSNQYKIRNNFGTQKVDCRNVV